jgi:hypothetical protein
MEIQRITLPDALFSGVHLVDGATVAAEQSGALAAH